MWLLGPQQGGPGEGPPDYCGATERLNRHQDRDVSVHIKGTARKRHLQKNAPENPPKLPTKVCFKHWLDPESSRELITLLRWYLWTLHGKTIFLFLGSLELWNFASHINYYLLNHWKSLLYCMVLFFLKFWECFIPLSLCLGNFWCLLLKSWVTNNKCFLLSLFLSWKMILLGIEFIV